MLIQHKKVDSKGMFFVENNGHIQAEMVYTLPAPDKMIIEHTEVSDELKGQKVGYELVQTAVEYARKHNMKIVPLCPFANAVFKKKPEYADVLYTHNANS
jgi:predicted GNAT family acetyltransferase